MTLKSTPWDGAPPSTVITSNWPFNRDGSGSLVATLRRMRRRLHSALLVAAAALVATALIAPPALADGDPASDVLLGENVFYPYKPVTSNALMRTLNEATVAAAKAHFPIKVALIGSPFDLGIIPQLFGKAQRYAAYLDVEISFEHKQPLLVVMKNGYGVEGLPPTATAAVAKLPLPAGGSSNDLARAADIAIGRLAAAAGHRITGPSAGSGGSSGGGGANTVLLIVLVLAAVATAAALIIVRRRQPT
jgi:hypothetical protein